MRSEHVAIVGRTDVGKTPLLREMHERINGMSIFVDKPGEITSGFGGVKAAKLETAREKIEERYDHFKNARLHLNGADMHKTAWNAIEIGREVYRETHVPFQIIIDESQNIFTQRGYEGPQENPVGKLLHEGKNMGGKVVIATQDPMEWPSSPLRQVRWFCWVGSPAGSQGSWLDHNIANWIPENHLPGSGTGESVRFKYTVFDHFVPRDAPAEKKVAYKGKTKEEYGT